MEGRFDEARQGWQHVMEADPGCELARLNDVLIEAEIERLKPRHSDLRLLELAERPNSPMTSTFSTAGASSCSITDRWPMPRPLRALIAATRRMPLRTTI